MGFLGVITLGERKAWLAKVADADHVERAPSARAYCVRVGNAWVDVLLLTLECKLREARSFVASSRKKSLAGALRSLETWAAEVHTSLASARIESAVDEALGDADAEVEKAASPSPVPTAMPSTVLSASREQTPATPPPVPALPSSPILAVLSTRSEVTPLQSVEEIEGWIAAGEANREAMQAEGVTATAALKVWREEQARAAVLRATLAHIAGELRQLQTDGK